jgi:MurNAc alpha-1-phosphate uridylyltransferase
MQAHALILAAGRGERMRPLSDTCPKPLLCVGGRPLIEWHLLALAAAGVKQVVINCAWLEDRFPAALGDGARFNLTLHYSMETAGHGGALETGGGIAKALPWLCPRGDEPFWLVSGDVFAPTFDFSVDRVGRFAASDDDGWLWLVDKPDFQADGDFALGAGGRLQRPRDPSSRDLTYANIALLRPRIVAAIRPGTRAALGPLLFASADAGRLGGERLPGRWENVGTPGQLAALNSSWAGVSAPTTSVLD